MIKVNLMKNRVGDTTQMATAQATSIGGGGGGGGGVNDEAKEAAIKLVVICLFTAGLMLYESQNIHALQAEVQRLTAQATDLDQQVQAKDKEVESIKDIESQARELDDKLKVLKLLSRMRLREVKTLDFIQSAIPEKVWLGSLNYEADKEKFENGHFSFTGKAVATEDLTEFVKRLEDSAYLYEVIVLKNQEFTVQNASKAVIRDFQFSAQVEVKP
jgi:Tfp pilus assembly protein PilN